MEVWWSGEEYLIYVVGQVELFVDWEALTEEESASLMEIEFPRMNEHEMMWRVFSRVMMFVLKSSEEYEQLISILTNWRVEFLAGEMLKVVVEEKEALSRKLKLSIMNLNFDDLNNLIFDEECLPP